MSDPCKDCGQCCMSQESPPMYVGYLPGAPFENEDCADARRVRNMPQALRDELTAYMKNVLTGVKPPHPTYPACLWYDAASKRCKHHDLRPDICRDFEVGDKYCQRYRIGAGLVRLTISQRR